MHKGQMYEVIHRSETQRYNRVSTMRFLGKTYDGELQFDARPVAGTQTMPANWVKGYRAINNDSKPSLNNRA